MFGLLFCCLFDESAFSEEKLAGETPSVTLLPLVQLRPITEKSEALKIQR